MADAHVPAEIEILDKAEIKIRWKDGVTTAMPAREVRLLCPCATCVEEMTGRRILNPATVPADVRAARAELVGRYAVQIFWSDGHNTGIYDFKSLREWGEGAAS